MTVVSNNATSETPPTGTASRRAEGFVFLVIAAGIWPIVSVAIVGGFGFLIWMYQLIYGPPGPPPH